MYLLHDLYTGSIFSRVKMTPAVCAESLTASELHSTFKSSYEVLIIMIIIIYNNND